MQHYQNFISYLLLCACLVQFCIFVHKVKANVLRTSPAPCNLPSKINPQEWKAGYLSVCITSFSPLLYTLFPADTYFIKKCVIIAFIPISFLTFLQRTIWWSNRKKILVWLRPYDWYIQDISPVYTSSELLSRISSPCTHNNKLFITSDTSEGLVCSSQIKWSLWCRVHANNMHHWLELV